IQCELLGRRQEEVRRELGYSVRTLKSRLKKAKDLLHKRMAARGLTLSSILLSLMLSPGNEATAVPPELAANTLRGLLLFVRGQEVVAGTSTAANPVAAELAGLAIRRMFLTQIRTRMIGVVLALVLAGGGLGAWQVLAHRAAPANPSTVAAPANETPVPREGASAVREKAAQPEVGPKVAEPIALARGKVLDAAGKPVPFATVTALVRRPFRPGEHGLRDEVVARGQADEQGAFRLRVPAYLPTWFPERQVVLVAKAPGRAPLTTLVRLAEQEATEVDLRLTAAERVVRGRLLAPDGTAACGVQ